MMSMMTVIYVPTIIHSKQRKNEEAIKDEIKISIFDGFVFSLKRRAEARRFLLVETEGLAR